MTLAALADLAEIIGALGVIVGLVFVGMQIQQNTKQMRRAEGNSAMAQGSALRHLIVGSRESAQMIASGVAGAPLDPVDELRLNMFFLEVAYSALQVWDRARNKFGPADEFLRVVSIIAPVVTSDRGRVWWAKARTTFWPEFVADFETLLPLLKPGPPPAPAPSAKAPQGPETGVAPPADAG